MKAEITSTKVKKESAGTIIESHVNKTSYDKIVKNIQETWPAWKKELCNDVLIISAHSKKL